MDAEVVAFVGKVQEETSVLWGSFRAAFDGAQRAAVSAERMIGSPGPNRTRILTSLKWDRPCKIACLEIYRFCRAAIAVIDNVITGKWFSLN